jgi:hypothetical protein
MLSIHRHQEKREEGQNLQRSGQMAKVTLWKHLSMLPKQVLGAKTSSNRHSPKKPNYLDPNRIQRQWSVVLALKSHRRSYGQEKQCGDRQKGYHGMCIK